MDQNRFQLTDKLASILATYSMFCGIMGLFFCFIPPVQLFVGSSALILAYASCIGRRRTGKATAGAVLGVISILLSILLFLNFIISIRLLDDPANAAFMREIWKEYADLFNSVKSSQ